MSLLSHDSFWNAVVTLPMTRKMLELTLSKCDSCGRTVLDFALDDYGGRAEKQCSDCSVLYSRIIELWIEFLRRSLNVSKEKTKKLLSDSYARKAVANLAQPFAYIGSRQPLSIYSPSLVVW